VHCAKREPIYLDHQATTPLDPAVWEAMVPYFGLRFGNAASRHHAFGREAEAAVSRAREQVAAALGASPEEIVWTSGATEATNLALKGMCERAGYGLAKVYTSRLEHQATLDTCNYLATRGVKVHYIPNDEHGRMLFAEDDTRVPGQMTIASLIHANNEIGTLQDLDAAVKFAANRECLLHLDAAQSFGKVPLDARKHAFDLASLSAHKLYGPKGVGALFLRKRVPRLRPVPSIHGGGHELGFRSGTLNVPAIVGFGAAAELAVRNMASETVRLEALRAEFVERVIAGLDGVRVNGHPEARLPGNVNLTIEGVESERLLMALDDVALSNGSACSSSSLKPSHVLLACGLDEQQAFNSIRIGFGRSTTQEDVRYAASRIVDEAARLRALVDEF
jgi:cysteine desulfurase